MILHIDQFLRWVCPERIDIFAREQIPPDTIQAQITLLAQPHMTPHQRPNNWDEFLLTSFDQAKSYVDYVTGKASFDTHQGVKGLEFPRVMVIIDDSAARGFLFSYDKLFGVKDKTKSDLDNEKAGRETGIDRTRRLFYVTCSRAEESLAIVAYSDSPQAVKQNVVNQGWFGECEVEII